MTLHSKFDLQDLINALSTEAQTAVTSASVISTSVFRIELTGHTYNNGDTLFTSGFGVLDADRQYATVSNVSGNFFDLDVDGTGYVSGGNVQLAPAGNPLWESSSIDALADGSWVFLGNHGDGAVGIDVSTPATPTNPQWYDGPTGVLITGGATGNSIRLRIRALAVSGNHLFCVPNANDSTTSRPERGLIVLDVTDPTAVTGGNFVTYPVGIEDNDLWGDYGVGDPGWGDQIIQGITVFENYAYVPNGQRGTFIYDISDPDAVVPLGLRGQDIASGTNLYQCFVNRANNGKTYAYYSGGYQPVPTRTLWVDQVTGGNMADLYIGIRPGDIVDNSDQSLSSTVARAASNSVGNYDVPEGYELVELGFRGAQSVANKLPSMGLYPGTSASDGTPVDTSAVVAGSITQIDLGATTGVTSNYTFTVSPSVPVSAGNYAPTVVSNSGSADITIRELNTGTHAKSTNTAGGTIPATWPDNGTSTGTLIVWAGFNLSVTTAPTLTTPYADLINMDGDVVAGVDLNTNITGETSLVVTWYPAIPNGLSESGGVVSGTVTTPTGTTTCTVTGTNSFGSVSDSFQWTTRHSNNAHRNNYLHSDRN
jgi:hypothetical protein